MNRIKLIPGSGLFNLYVRFHAGEITDKRERTLAKTSLYPIHYGTGYDTSEADAEVLRRRGEANNVSE